MRFRNCLVCEDVRVEQNGKHILIGVFTTDIRILGASPVFQVVLWFQVESMMRDREFYKFRVTLAGEKKIEGDLELARPGEYQRAAMILPGLQIQVTQSGDMKFEVQERGSRKWQQLLTMPVLLNPEPIASQPPS